MQPYETFEHSGYRIRIFQDSDPQRPDDWDGDAFLIANHDQFCIERKEFDCDANTPKDHKADYHVLPLIAYIHSGVSLSLGRSSYPFNDPWDSGQVGWILVKKRAGVRNVRKAAQSLVDVWNQYLEGDVWGYIVDEVTDDEDRDIDSCWGFYGLDHCRNDAIESAKHTRKQEDRESVLIDKVMHL